MHAVHRFCFGIERPADNLSVYLDEPLARHGPCEVHRAPLAFSELDLDPVCDRLLGGVRDITSAS
jgi:hypothetical protein